MYWTRHQLKTQAKAVLKRSYWPVFLISLILGLVGGGISFGTSFFNSYSGSPGGYTFPEAYEPGAGLERFWENLQSALPVWSDGIMGAAVIIVVIAVFAGLAIGIAYSLFLSCPIIVGCYRWLSYNRLTPKHPPYKTAFSAFGPDFMKTVGGMAWYMLWITIWSLLAVLPAIVFLTLFAVAAFTGRAAFAFAGIICLLVSIVTYVLFIIKSIEYSMTPWILADNPKIGYKRALELSKQMTQGHKGGIFVLNLSFIGWYLLGFLACCIGVIFVAPYVYATNAELYAALRGLSADKGDTTYEELNMLPYYPPADLFPQSQEPLPPGTFY